MTMKVKMTGVESEMKDGRDQIKNTRAKNVKLHDQIKQVITVECTLISLYKKEGWTPPRTDRRPVKVSESYISRREASSLINNAEHDHLVPDTSKWIQISSVFMPELHCTSSLFFIWNASIAAINLNYWLISIY